MSKRGFTGIEILLYLGISLLISSGVIGYLYVSEPAVEVLEIPRRLQEAPPAVSRDSGPFPLSNLVEKEKRTPGEIFPEAREHLVATLPPTPAKSLEVAPTSPAETQTSDAVAIERLQQELAKQRSEFNQLISQLKEQIAEAKKAQSTPKVSIAETVEQDLERQRTMEGLRYQLSLLTSQLESLKSQQSVTPPPQQIIVRESTSEVLSQQQQQLQQQIQQLQQQLSEQRRTQENQSSQQLSTLQTQLNELQNQLDTQKQLTTEAQKKAQEEVASLKQQLESLQTSAHATAATIVSAFKSATAFVRCGSGFGSGTVFAHVQNASVILTNWHVISNDEKCLIYYGEDPINFWDKIFVAKRIIFGEGQAGFATQANLQELDFGFLILEAEMIENPVSGELLPNYSASLSLPENVIGVLCPPSIVGERVVAMGYPGAASANLQLIFDDILNGIALKDILYSPAFVATQGIISGYNLGTTILGPSGELIIPRWNADVKIDSGNSGGGAYSLDNFCYVGPPTSVTAGGAFGGTFLSQILDIPYIAKLYPALFEFLRAQTFGF